MHCRILEMLRYLQSICASLIGSGASTAAHGPLRPLNRAPIIGGVARRGRYLRLICEMRLPGHALKKGVVPVGGGAPA